jgi:hypothetical protein
MKKRFVLINLLILSAFVFTACNLPVRKEPDTGVSDPALANLAGTNTPNATIFPAATPTVTSEPSLCDHPYQPTGLGDTWFYSGSNSASSSYTRTDTISSSGARDFSVGSNLAGVDYTVDYSCTLEGLIANNPVQQYLGALLVNPSTNLEVTLISVSGISLPSEINPGDSWQQVAEVDATLNGTSMNGWIVFNYTAVGIENISVPMGIVSHLAVDAKIKLMCTPLRILAGQYNSTFWLAPDIGMVKSTGVSDVPGISFTDSMELTRFSPAQ